MSRSRLNVYLNPDHAKRLTVLAKRQKLSRSGLVASAIAWYLSPEGSQAKEVNLLRRFDRLAHQLERLERDQIIQTEALALFIRHHLSVTIPIPEAQQQAARAQGRARFEQFIEQLARHLQRGGSLVRDVWVEVQPTSPESGAPPEGKPATGAEEEIA